MSRRLVLVAIALLTLTASAPAATSDQVRITAFGFDPEEVTVGPGEGIHWTNVHLEAQSVTSDDGLFDSGLVPPGGGYSMSLSAPGVHTYGSEGDTAFQGTIRVVSPTLQGEPGDLAVHSIPDVSFPPARPTEIAAHPLFGVDASTRRILLGIPPDATVGAVNDALAAVDADVIGGLPSLDVLLVQVAEDPAWAIGDDGTAEVELEPLGRFTGLAAALTRLRSSRAFAFASMSSAIDTTALPRRAEQVVENLPGGWPWDAEGGANWGLKDARFPFAWNLRESLAQDEPGVVTGIIDAGFHAHPDLNVDVRERLCPSDGVCERLPNNGTEKQKNHGTHVAGIIGAAWDNPAVAEPPRSPRSKGVSGGNPFARMLGTSFANEHLLDEGVELFDVFLRSRPDELRVINYSARLTPPVPATVATKFPNATCGPGTADDDLPGFVAGTKVFCTPNVEDGWLREMAHAGMTSRWVAEAAAREGVMIVAAAGNESTRYCVPWGQPDCHSATIRAEHASEWAWASRHWERDDLPNPIVVVEATRPDGTLAPYSNPGGDVAAPGSGVGSTLGPAGYGVLNGTSMATPHVSAAIGQLLAAQPDLTIDDVRERLLDWGRRPPARDPLPTNVFDWRVPDHLGHDTDLDEIVDAHESVDDIRRPGYPVDLDACGWSVGGDPIVLFTWTLNGETIESTSCLLRYSFPAEGEYPVTVTFTDADGDDHTGTRTVKVDDLLVVALGDGLASGEGAPDASGSSAFTSAKWQNQRCHRSAKGGVAQAPRWLEITNSQSSVTFLNLACSGARIRGDVDGAGGLVSGPDGEGGLLTPYRGLEPEEPPLSPQVDELEGLAGPREVDALVLSAGAGDLRLREILSDCLVPANNCSTGAGHTVFEQRLALLPARYDELAAKLGDVGVAADRVFVTQYPDFTRNDAGAPDLGCVPGGAVSAPEAAWLGNTVLPQLNAALADAAARHGWTRVTGAAGFGTHGYCSSQPWVRKGTAAQLAGFRAGSAELAGLFHANKDGQAEIGRSVVEVVRAKLALGDVNVRGVFGDASPRLDAYAALLAGDGAVTRLVDVNDASLDGNRRVIRGLGPDGAVTTSLDRLLAPRTVPDGLVDMRDFRRFRDAWLAECLARGGDVACPADAGEIVLDGGDDHPKRDLNVDGCVQRAGDPDGCGAREHRFSRFDFNGDGFTSVERKAFVPLTAQGEPAERPRDAEKLTDLDLLRTHWAPEVGGEGWEASDLERLLRSGDVTVHAGRLLSYGARKGEVEVRTLAGEPVGSLRTVKRSKGSIVVTVPVSDPNEMFEVVGTASTANGTTELRSAPFSLRYGEDVRVDLCSGLNLESTATRLPRDGQAQATLTARLLRCGGEELAGKDVSWSVAPATSEAPQLETDHTTTDDSGKTSVRLTAGTEAGSYTVRTTVDLGLGETEETELAIELVPAVKIRYAWKQIIDEWSEEGSTKWGFSDPERPDCLTAAVEYCIDSFSVGLDPETPYELERRGRLTGIGDQVKLTESDVTNSFGRSRASWTLSHPEDETDTEDGGQLTEWNVTDPERYRAHPLTDVTIADEEDGIHLHGLQAVGDLPYHYDLSAVQTHGISPTPPETHAILTDFLLVPQGDGRRLRFAAHPEHALVFPRSGESFEPFVSCGRLVRDLTTEPGYLVQEEDNEYVTGGVRRKPEFEPGDRPMPVGPGTLRVRYAFAATVSYDDEEPLPPELPECGANEPPVADFELPPEPIEEGEVVRFVDRSTDSDHDLDKYEWETSADAHVLSLPDVFEREKWSRTSGRPSPAFVFRNDGPVTVKLTVTDGAGETATVEKQLTVVNAPPEASIDDVSGQAGEPFELLYRVGDRSIADRAALRVRLTSSNPAWPGTIDEVVQGGVYRNAAFVAPAGVYPLTLTVTDPDGATASDKATVVVTSAPPDEEVPDGGSVPTCDPTVVLDDEEYDFLELVNDYRELNGLAPVVASPTLTRASERHADDMAENDFTGHDGSDGSSPGSRADDAGYPPEATIAENVTQGRTGFNALWSWRNSISGHNEAMLVPEWRVVGIARSEGSSWRWATTYGDTLDCPGAASPASEPAGLEAAAMVSDSKLSQADPEEGEALEQASFARTPRAASLAAGSVEQASLTAEAPASAATPLPTVAFTLSDATPREGVPVVFTNRSRDVTGAPIGATIEIDASTQLVLGPNENASHTFTTAGAHSARAVAGAAEVTRPIDVAAKIPLALDYIGPTGAFAGGRIEVLARADDSAAAVPVAGAELTFELAGASATATSGADGRAGTLLPVPGAVGSYELTVRFAGDDDYLPAETTATIDVLANALPVPHAGGPYVVGEGQSLFLDGTRSRDDDAGDRVRIWQWDLNGDGSFDDATGATPAAVGWPALQLLVCGGSCEIGRGYAVTLRTEDTRGAAATASTTLTFTSDFSVVMAGGTITLVPGASNHFGLTVVGSSAWTHPVTLSVQGLPAGVTASFSRNPVTPTGTSVLTLAASSSVTNGTFAITVTGTGNGVTRVAGADVEVTFGLIPECFGAYAGTITDRDTGQPLADAPIFESGRVIARTDENGRYVIDGIRLGFNNAPVTTGLTAAFDGYWQVTTLAEASCGVVTQVDFALRLKRPGRVSGRVIDKETRVPIEGATASFPTLLEPYRFTTDADGRFAGEVELSPDNAPKTYSAQATAPGYWPQGLGVTASAESEATVAFELVRVCHATFGGGVVHRRNTQIPVANAVVRLSGPSGIIAGVTTDAEGRFRFDRQVPLGHNNQPVTYTLSASPPIGSPPGSDGGFQNVAITSCGQVVPDVGLTVYVPTQNFGDVEGHVRDEETGEPIAGASVGVDFRFTTTDANGYYRFDDVFVGNDHILTRGVFLTVSKQGYYASNVSRQIAANTTTTVDLVMLRMRQGHASGTVTDALTGAPIEGALVTPFGVGTDREGAYSSLVTLGFRNSPVAGQVRAEAPGYWPLLKSATFRADETTVTDFALVRECAAARVTGRVVNAATQEPIANAFVGSDDGWSTATDATGRFVLTGLRAGVNNVPIVRTLTAAAPGFNFAQRQITIFCGANVVVDFGSSTSNSASIVGTVTNLDTGQPIAGATVGAEFGAVATTDAAGSFRFASVPLGHQDADREWKLTALVQGFRPHTVAVVARANQEVRADIGLTKAGNTRPVADPKTYVAHEDVGMPPQPLTLTGSDVDGDAVTFHIVRNPLHGRVRGLAPNVDYVATEANYNGSDSFEYITFDGQDFSERATVDITVLPVNDSPRATNDAFQRPRGAPARIPIADILANDSDADGDPLSISSANAFFPAQARIEGSELVVTPAASQTSASVLYSITDGKGAFANARIDVTFVVLPLAPVCAAAAFRGPQDTTLSGRVQCTDGNGDALTYAVVREPAVGTLGFAANGTFEYEPPAGFAGETTFEFRASDGALTSEPTTVALVVDPTNHAPVAADASVALDEDSSAAITPAATDADGDELTYSIVTGPAHGTLSGTAPNLTYTPAANYHGPDSIVFRASDGTLADEATVSIEVRPVNDPPGATDDAGSTAEDEPLELLSPALLANDGDVDGDPLTLTAVGDASNGAVTLAQGTVRFVPAADFAGTAGFGYTIADPDGETASAHVTVTVAAANDAPVADDASVLLDEDTPTAIELEAADVDGDALAYSIVTPPAHGSLTGTVPNLNYAPAANYHGPDSFVFRASDGSLGDDATVSISVQSVNDPPDATNDIASTTEDEPLTLQAAALLANDGDVDGDALTVTAVAQPEHGTVSLEQGTIRFTPAPHFSGDAGFAYTISDGHGGADTARVAITVTGVNRKPAVELGEAGLVGEATAVSLAATASDPDGDALTYSWHSTAGELTGTEATASLVVDDGPAEVTVTVRVTDPDGAAAEAFTVVDIHNLPPIADAGPDRTGHWGRPLALTGSVSDPSRADTAAGFDPRWTSGAAGLTTELTFEDPGSYAAGLTATDKDGGSATDAAQVRIDARGTAVAWTGRVTDTALGHVTLSARLSDLVHATTARLADRTIAFDVAGRTYTATTDALGDAQVGLPAVLGPGTHSIRIGFAADSHYLGSETVATVTVGEAPRKVLLVLDENSIDNGARFNATGGALTPGGPSFFSRLDVNGDRAGATQRTTLRYFAANVGATITVGTGQTGDEGWFAPTCIPQRWLTGSGGSCLAGAAREEAIDRFVGSHGSAAIPSQSRLEAVPAVMPLRARGLASLVGASVCAVVYDGDIAVNYSGSGYPYTSGNLKGATLGVVAFDVSAVRRQSGFSSSTLPEVQLTIRGTSSCGGWALLNAPVPRSTSVPNDVDPARPAGTGSNGYRSLLTWPGEPLFLLGGSGGAQSTVSSTGTASWIRGVDRPS